MIRKILVPVDGSDHAKKVVETAADIASKYNAVAYLIHVFSVTHLTTLLSRSYGETALESLIDEAEEAAVEIIREAEKYVKERGVEVSQSYVTQGDPAEEILRFAKRKGIDTIVIGSHGARGVLAGPLGGVCHKVCRLAEHTCVIVK